MTEGTDFSQISHLLLSKPERDLAQPVISVSKKVGLCLEQGTYAGCREGGLGMSLGT